MNNLSSSNRIWFIAVLAGALFLAGGIGFGIWKYVQPKPVQPLETIYAKIEAAGFPLDAKSFSAKHAVPNEENNHKELLPILSTFDPRFREFVKAQKRHRTQTRYSFADLVTRITFKVDGMKVPPLRERQDAHSGVKPLIDQVFAAAKKPYYVPNGNWDTLIDSDLSDLDGSRTFLAILRSRAVLLAESGDREGSLQTLRSGIRFTSMFANVPTSLNAIFVEVNLGHFAICVTRCAEADPSGANEYRQVLTEVKPPVPSRYLLGELFMVASSARQYDGTRRMPAASIEGSGTANSPTAAELLSDEDLPRTAQARARLAYSLSRWLPIVDQLNPDGTSKDAKKLRAALEASRISPNSKGSESEQFHAITFPNLETTRVLAVEIQELLALADAVCRVVDYRHRTGKLPDTLAGAGISAQNKLTPPTIQIGFRRDNAVAEIWSINMIGKSGIPAEKQLSKFLVKVKAR